MVRPDPSMPPDRTADPGPELAWQSINAIRALSMDAVEQAQSGHPGTPMALAPAGYLLWTRFLRHNPRNPEWIDRDRFVLSCGHASMLLYSLLHLTGYDLSLEEIKNFRQWGSKTPGHPERGHTPGVETTTGPLGQGFGNAVGMAIAERFLAEHFNRPDHTVVDHRTWVFASDGDLMEGVASEAASLAGHLRLGKLTVVYDDNHITIDGDTSLTFSEDVARRFEAYGWRVLKVGDGNDLAAIGGALETARGESARPTLIVLRTVIADPAPTKRNSADAHGAPLGAEEVRRTKEIMGWPLEPKFYVPEDALTHWRTAVGRGAEQEAAWQQRLRCLHRRPSRPWPLSSGSGTRASSRPAGTRPGRAHRGRLAGHPAGVRARPPIHRRSGAQPGGRVRRSGRQHRHHAQARRYLRAHQRWPHLPLGSAGARHGGLPQWNCRPRRAASVRQHLSGVLRLHEAGHPPGRHHAPAGRSTSELTTRSAWARTAPPTSRWSTWPCCARFPTWSPCVQPTRPRRSRPGGWPWSGETDLPCWCSPGRSCPCSTRSPIGGRRWTRRGAYVLLDAPGGPDSIMIATGSEVTIALEAARDLHQEGIRTRVVSMPSWELFAAQPESYRDSVLPPAVRSRVAVEAAGGMGWSRWTTEAGAMVGMVGFGASAPGERLFQEFQLTPERVAETVRRLLTSRRTQ